MDSEKGFRPEKAVSPNPLKLFFDEQIFPHLSEWERDNITFPPEIKFEKEQLLEEYDRFSKYDPSTDRGRDFFSSVLVPFYMISFSDDNRAFENMEALFMQKTKALAEVLYRGAFFRNRYDSLEAWRSCASFKEYQALLKDLNVLPAGAEERVAGMSKELDDLWSQPEVERSLENAIADEHVEAGVGEKSMLVQMYRNEFEPIPEAEYGGYHELSPDHFSEKYEDYLKQLEELKHPYRLEL